MYLLFPNGLETRRERLELLYPLASLRENPSEDGAGGGREVG